MTTFATGKKSYAISDRSGQRFPYDEMVTEWNGSFVHYTEYEPKQPQLEPKVPGNDPQGLLNARPDRVDEIMKRCTGAVNKQAKKMGINTTLELKQ